METKEMKIQVPAGYEIDKENSTFECIKFRPIKRGLTYEDIQNILCKTKERKYTICFAKYKNSIYDLSPSYLDGFDKCTTKNQVLKLLAINKLMNVAKYLNGNWSPNWNSNEKKYYAYIEDGHIKILYYTSCHCGDIYFKSPELVCQAIKILGENTIRTALSTDW